MSSTSVSPSKEKFCSLIGEIVDKSCNIIVDTEEALEYDAVELTVLLKSIGFRLNSFEFDSAPAPEANEIEIDIRCKRSGITSKLLLNAKKCTCPERNKKAENNNSYWEIQSRGPQNPICRFKGIVKDTSCDLLPDISRKSANIARTTLAMLLQNYKNDFSPDKEKSKVIDIKAFAEYLNIKMPNSEELSSASRTNSMPSIIENDTKVPKSQIAKNLTSTRSDTNLNSGGCENGKDNEKCDSGQASLSSQKSDSIDLNELNFEFDYEANEKDRNLVKKILKAKKELDNALKLLKTKPNSINYNQLSNITIKDDTTTSAIAKQQPQTTVKTRKSFPAYQASRRSSIGNSSETSTKSPLLTPKAPNRISLVKRQSFNAASKTSSQPPKNLTLRRTSSGTNLLNPTKGPVTKSNVTKSPNITKKY